MRYTGPQHQNKCPFCQSIHHFTRTACPQCGAANRNIPFCQNCAGSHGPNDPCPALSGPKTLPGTGTPRQPFFQFNNVAGASQKPEETDNDHLLTANTWTCEACGTANDADRFPGRCSICRRYR